MAEGFHLTGPFQDQPPSPDHQTIERDCHGRHLQAVDREISSNHADQNRDGGKAADIYPGEYARESGEETIKEQTASTASELQIPGRKHSKVHGSSVSCLIIIS